MIYRLADTDLNRPAARKFDLGNSDRTGDLELACYAALQAADVDGRAVRIIAAGPNVQVAHVDRFGHLDVDRQQLLQLLACAVERTDECAADLRHAEREPSSTPRERNARRSNLDDARQREEEAARALEIAARLERASETAEHAA